jgi:elongation factor 1 alpha-like protein
MKLQIDYIRLKIALSIVSQEILFETGFELGGQTREHSLLVKSLGVSHIVVAVNKMDMCDWSQDRFNTICKKLGNFLVKQVGFKEPV